MRQIAGFLAVVAGLAIAGLMFWGIDELSTMAQPPAVPARAPIAAIVTTDAEVSQMADWLVSGAGDDSYNGEYSLAGEYGGKPYYTFGTGDGLRYLWWAYEWPAPYWTLGPLLGEVEEYRGPEDASGVDLPANPWTAMGGAEPAPVVSVAPVLPGVWIATEIALQPYTPSFEEMATGIRVGLRPVGASANVVGAIYNATTGALVGSTAQETITEPNIYILDLTTNCRLYAGQNYLFAIWGQLRQVEIGMEEEPEDSAREVTEPELLTYPNWPATLPATNVHEWGGAWVIGPALTPVLDGEQVGAYSRGQAQGEETIGAYSRDSADMPVVAGQNIGAYCRGVTGKNLAAYSRGIGGGNTGVYDRGVGGQNTGVYDRGVGGRTIGAYARGPEIALHGRNIGAYSRARAESGENTGAYARGRRVGQVLTAAYSRGLRLGGVNVGAYSRGTEVEPVEPPRNNLLLMLMMRSMMQGGGR